MKFSVLLLFIVMSINSFSQNKFEEGYYIDNLNNKINCFIKNYDWQKNPDSFEIKESENSIVTTITLATAKEVSISTKSKYLRETVEIETSTNNRIDLIASADLVFTTKTVFLQVLIEGNNSLYKFESIQIPVKFFFKVNNEKIEQLIYRKYYSSARGGLTAINQDYKKQLFKNSNCTDVTIDDVQKINYNLDDLIVYFTKINKCQNNLTTKIYFEKQKIRYYFRPLLNLNYSEINLDISNTNVNGKYSLGNKLNIGLGAEIEFLLPINNFAWSVFLEPSYNSYQSTILIPKQYSADAEVVAKYNYIQLPIGIRRNIYVNPNSDLTLNLAFNLRSAINSKVEIDKELLINLSGFSYNINAGIGYSFKKFKLGLNYYPEKIINNDEQYQKVIFSNFDLNIRYSFNSK